MRFENRKKFVSLIQERNLETVTFSWPFVLGNLAQAIQDAVVLEEPVDAWYGPLEDFLFLTAVPLCPKRLSESKQCPHANWEDHALENFANVLFNVPADVDLNYPSVQRLLSSVLCTLEHHTKVVTKIGRAFNNQKAGNLIGGAVSAVIIKSVALESSAGDEEITIGKLFLNL
ncbi:hypothetical protein BY996DRAFT_6418777 [Phakopsora pachyrhizi]|uniref:Uncharacterized protein n=1 Tax=Phakopsora pachyrhizi TaxID=170000 RepID=A0AAV0BAM7_PHAPC|nr:hypothetical protein BY996DRAFT_8409641 [Phakopsora pachyrhizi]KAI8449171.1 hypothetical protein BY996DRAFT_6418777 [Phakopsora pachyrhizi]CAH7682982.1 hypothetical protein PPACK8108_LOCUS16187 [Phakopsora pachyrhizi]CAH7682986.1 hypothetical protein PPACK8108_LOCUS16191 [Phakopsora pachyrhizi]